MISNVHFVENYVESIKDDRQTVAQSLDGVIQEKLKFGDADVQEILDDSESIDFARKKRSNLFVVKLGTRKMPGGSFSD